MSIPNLVPLLGSISGMLAGPELAQRAASALGGVHWRLKNDLMGAYTWNTIADALGTREATSRARRAPIRSASLPNRGVA